MKNLFSRLFAKLVPVESAYNETAEQRKQRLTDFKVPKLSEANTIMFTIVLQEDKKCFLRLYGSKIAIDWGDGYTVKDMNPENGEPWRTTFTHVYKRLGTYKVKIWAEEVTVLEVVPENENYKDLHIGNCPNLLRLSLNSFTNLKTINFNNCRKLETLHLAQCLELESIVADRCSDLKELKLKNVPKLTTLDMRNNPKLENFTCFHSGLEDIKLPSNMKVVECFHSNLRSVAFRDFKQLTHLGVGGNADLTSLDITGCSRLWSLDIGSTNIESFDFSIFPDLDNIFCAMTPMKNIDVSANENLAMLTCSDTGLESLDVTNNPKLVYLHCCRNELTALDLSKNRDLDTLFINNNQLEKEALETIFAAVPEFDPEKNNPSRLKIDIKGNPGIDSCDTTIITDKGWAVLE